MKKNIVRLEIRANKKAFGRSGFLNESCSAKPSEVLRALKPYHVVQLPDRFASDLIDHEPTPPQFCWSCRQYAPNVTKFRVGKDFDTLSLTFENLPTEIGLCADHAVVYMTSFNCAHARLTGITVVHWWTKKECHDFLGTRQKANRSLNREGVAHDNQ